jgi:ribose-phosphate pyrophosphokinase
MKDWIPFDARLARVWRNPSGEIGVRAAGPAPRRLLARLSSADDVVALLLYLAAAPGVEEVCLPYLAYSRQDRVAAPGDPVSIAVLARLLATSGVRRFASFDVHSPASFDAFAAAGLELRELPVLPYLERFVALVATDRAGAFWFVAPDHGAEARTRAAAAALSTPRRPIGVITCTKRRDPLTRVTNGFAVADDAPARLGPRPTLIAVDDICESGDTLLGVAGALRARYGPEANVDFWTTHGVYSRGVDALLADGRRAGCTDSYRHGLAHPRLITIPLDEA